MATQCNCNGNLIPSGNDFYLAIALKSRSLVDGEVVETPFDFEAADTYNARIYSILDGTTLSTMAGLKDGSTDTVVVDAKGVPLIRAIGVEVTGEVDGRAFRAAEKGFLSIVEFNGEAKVVFTPVTGGQEANLVMTLTFLPSAAVVGKNAYEIWKEEPGNQDKTLADFIYFLGHGESAYEIAVRYGYTGTEAEYNMLYFDAVDVANTAGQNAQQAADTANEMAAHAQDAAELADAATTNANNAATAAAATVDAAIGNMENTLNAAIAAQDAEIASKEAEIDEQFATQTALINQKQMEIGAVPSDLAPTTGSTNWVTSGGVKAALRADNISYDSSQSWLAAENVQEAVYNIDSNLTLNETLDLSSLNTFNRNTDPSKKWKSTYYGTIIPVASGEVYDIIPQEGKVAVIMPLKRASWVIDESYADDIATGFSDRVVVAVGTTYRFVVPEDCVCLFVQTTIGSGDIIPTIIRRSAPSQAEDTVKYDDSLVSGKGIYEDGNVLMEPLVLKYSIQNFQLGSNMYWYGFSTTGNIRHSEVYDAHEGDVIQLTNNNEYTTWYAFLQGISTVENGKPCIPTTGRYVLNSSESVTIVAPKNTAYLYVTSETNGNVQRPQMVKYIKVKDASPNLGFTVELKGNGMTAAIARTVLKGGKTYRVSLDKTEWQKSSVTYETSIVFNIYVAEKYIGRTTKNFNPKKVYYLHVNEDSDASIAFRGDVGENINISVNDVTKDFNRQIFDIHFVDNTTYMESMMVKVGNGDLVRYRINAASGSTPIKMYSRSVRDDAYLLDSISAGEDGIMEGEFMPAKYTYGLDYTDEVFVVMQSVKSEGFTPYFHVFNYGEPEYGKIFFPHQFIVKPEEKVVLFSTNDAGATSYDDGVLNYAQIIPADGRYYMIYQAFGKTSHKSSNICFAYSDDGINWIKGIPEGIEPPIPGTNVIMDITNFSNIVNEFIDTAEVNNGCGVCEVNDPVNRYRMICSVRNVPNPSQDPDGTIVGMCEYMLKSNDLVHWICVKKITMKPHDSMPCLISYGDKIKAYIRMWDYTQPVDKRRMVGVMWLDIWGNVIVPDSGIGFRGEYNSAAVRIGPNTDLMIPTHFWVNNDGTWMHGDDELESYIVDNGVIRYAPSYNLDRIKDRSGAEGAYSGWAYGPGLVPIGIQQYILCKIGQGSHSVEVESSESQFCLVPIQWVTYDSYNTSGDVG